MDAGRDFVKWLKPGGCVLFLVVAILVTAVCLTSGRDPIPGYEAPKASEYYAQSADTLSELKNELEQNVFPRVAGVTGSSVEDGHLTVHIDDSSFAVTRAAILRYYSQELFEFIRD